VFQHNCGCLERTNVGALAGTLEVRRGGCDIHGPEPVSSSGELAAAALEAELLARLRELRERIEANPRREQPRAIALALTKLDECELWLLRALGRV
jgi:hypothetical protein